MGETPELREPRGGGLPGRPAAGRGHSGAAPGLGHRDLRRRLRRHVRAGRHAPGAGGRPRPRTRGAGVERTGRRAGVSGAPGGAPAGVGSVPGAAGERGGVGTAAVEDAGGGDAGTAPAGDRERSDAAGPAVARAALGWSGGKDAALALDAVLREGRLAVHALVTTVTDAYDRISMHGV